jgi:hypothetical protein
MATDHVVPDDIRERYHVKEWRNAAGVLTTASPTEWQEILEVLRGFTLLRSEVVVGGGNRSLISRRIDGAFYAKGWGEKGFATSIHVDATQYDSPTHAVDCYKAGVAVEMEWNNKDPFFDRDLNNFRLLFELRAIHVGIIITRSWELQQIFRKLGKGASYGKATTHHEKLWSKVEGGGGGGCPVLTFAILPALFVDDGAHHYRSNARPYHRDNADAAGRSPRGPGLSSGRHWHVHRESHDFGSSSTRRDNHRVGIVRRNNRSPDHRTGQSARVNARPGSRPLFGAWLLE